MQRGIFTQESIASQPAFNTNSMKNSVNIPKVDNSPSFNSLLPQWKQKNKSNVHEKIASLEQKIQTLILSDNPQNREHLWALVQEVAILNNGLGVKLIHKQKYEKAEGYLLKAKQISEPMTTKYSRNWAKTKEWLLIRLAIFQNLALIYKQYKKYEKAYELLLEFSKAIKIDIIIDRSEIIIAGGYENLYINLAHFCKKLRKYEESLFYAEKIIEFLQSLLRNPGLLKQISEEMKRQKNGFEFFLKTKNALLASLLFMKGKILSKQGKDEMALDFLNHGYKLISEYLGENNEKTLKFKATYENVRNKLNFLQEMGKNTDVKDFQAFKQEIDCTQDLKNDSKISSITELDEGEKGFDIPNNYDSQPLQIQRSPIKKQTAHFFFPMCHLPSKSPKQVDKNNTTNSLKTPTNNLKKSQENNAFSDKFNQLLKNSRILYPRNRSPFNKDISFQLDRETNKTSLHETTKKSTKSNSKSKSRSPSQNIYSKKKTPPTGSSLASFGNINKYLNSSAFYNKLSINAKKTKTLYNNTLGSILGKKKNLIKPFDGQTPKKYIEAFSQLNVNLNKANVFQQNHLNMLINSRPKTKSPLNPKENYDTKPGIQIITVNKEKNQEESNKRSEGTDLREKSEEEFSGDESYLMKNVHQRRPQKSATVIRKDAQSPRHNITKSDCHYADAMILAKRHTLTVNTNLSNKKNQMQYPTSGTLNKSKRFSSIERNMDINTAGIKTLASIAESFVQHNNNVESQILSKNDSSLGSMSQISNYEKDHNSNFKERKSSEMGASIPHIKRSKEIILRNQLTPKQKNHSEIMNQMTFQHMKMRDSKLKTMKSLEIGSNLAINFNNPNNISRGAVHIPSSPKIVKKAGTKKSISFVKENSLGLKNVNNNEQTSEGRSEELVFANENGTSTNLNNTPNKKTDIDEKILQDDFSFPQNNYNEIPLKSPSNSFETKYEKAAIFIQKAFRKIYRKRLLQINHMLSMKMMNGENIQDNEEIAEDLKKKISQIKLKEIISFLKTAKSMNSFLNFEEILNLKQFPIRFYTNHLNGYGLKSVFWKLNSCNLEEECKFIIADPEDVNTNDEWRYHDSFLLNISLKNSLNHDLFISIKTKERLNILKNKTKYIWSAAKVIIDGWFLKKGCTLQFENFLRENAKDKNNWQMICLEIKNQNEMSEHDSTELQEFYLRMRFIIEKLAYLVKKTTGYTWRFQLDCQNMFEYPLVNLQRFFFLKERYWIRRCLACYLNRNLGAFMSRYGTEKKLETHDPTEDIQSFMQNFYPVLKENTFNVLSQNQWKKIIFSKAYILFFKLSNFKLSDFRTKVPKIMTIFLFHQV